MNEYQTYWSSLSDEERNILTEYYDYSDEINNYLRSKLKNKSDLDEKINVIKGAIQKYSCPKDIVLYRGSILQELKGVKNGEIVTFDSFISTAIFVDTAVDYLVYNSSQPCLLIIIECCQNSNMALVNFKDGEEERILSSKQQFKILEYERISGKKAIICYLQNLGALRISRFNAFVLPKIDDLHIARIRTI